MDFWEYFLQFFSDQIDSAKTPCYHMDLVISHFASREEVKDKHFSSIGVNVAIGSQVPFYSQTFSQSSVDIDNQIKVVR